MNKYLMPDWTFCGTILSNKIIVEGNVNKERSVLYRLHILNLWKVVIDSVLLKGMIVSIDVFTVCLRTSWVDSLKC